MFRLLFWRRPRTTGGGAPEPDTEPVKLIVGLGNPGKQYERTRHNVGWWVVDHLADVWHFDSWKTKGDAQEASGSVAAKRVRLMKPLTYMNLSGSVLGPYLRKAAFSAATDLLIVVDEVALPLGRFRFRARGSSGGHNGLKSVEATVGSQEYARLRIGIRPSAEHEPLGHLADFVLDEFEPSEAATVRELFPTLTEAIELWLREGIAPVMSRFPGTSP